MTISLVQSCALIGSFICWISETSTNNRYNLIRNFGYMLQNFLLFCQYLEGVHITIITFLYFFVLLLCHGDTELSPGPKKLLKNSLSIYHWNLNILTAHNFSKLTQLKAYISMYKHDFICSSETYLDSSTLNGLLKIDGYPVKSNQE